MTLVTYPSPIVPGPPPLTIEAPDTWEQVWAPETLFAVREPERDGFLTNLVARYYQRGNQFGPEQAIEELRATSADKQGEVSEQFETEINGQAFFGAVLSFVDPESGTIAQLHAFTGNPRGEVIDVLQLTGSCAGARAREELDLLRNVMKTLRINP